MKPLRCPLPPNRTVEQAWNHYQVEHRLAQKLKAADRAQRQEIFATMYDELFAAVPDHPRLTRRADADRTARANASKLAALRRWIDKDSVVLEFAPGDGEFAAALAPLVRRVIGVDISDQRDRTRSWPANFDYLTYDGFDLPQVPSGSVDVVFSDQLLEHLHPEDAVSHLQLAHRLLRPGGRYAIRTPHAASGPWDVSRYFCEEPEGFHLKEWTFRELREALRSTGFSGFVGAWNARRICVPLPYAYFVGAERVAEWMRRSVARPFARCFLPTVMVLAVK